MSTKAKEELEEMITHIQQLQPYSSHHMWLCDVCTNLFQLKDQ